MAAAQSTVFLVRHAETAAAGAGERDPELSAAGRERAERLADLLKDAGITAVCATEFRRTQATATPTARMAGVEVTVVPGAAGSASVAAWLREPRAGAALVVGHSNTLPEILRALGVPTPAAIAESEYDHLFVFVPGAPEPRVIPLRYR